MAKVGRPPMFDTSEEMQLKIDAYFEEECKDKVMTDDDGKVLIDTRNKQVIEYNPPTVSGLALYLGFVNRNSMYDYEKKGEFTGTIKKAIAKIERYAEKQLFIGNSTGAIFWLKNKGWKDRQEIDQTVRMPNPLLGGESNKKD